MQMFLPNGPLHLIRRMATREHKDKGVNPPPEIINPATFVMLSTAVEACHSRSIRAPELFSDVEAV